MECKHAATGACDEMCACYCDKCQEDYETRWDARVQHENLCGSCGFPSAPYTYPQLQVLQYTHFFLPCPACETTFREFMELMQLCLICRTPLEGEEGHCPRCDGADSNTPHRTDEGGPPPAAPWPSCCEAPADAQSADAHPQVRVTVVKEEPGSQQTHQE